jgi:hypothetical protein
MNIRLVTAQGELVHDGEIPPFKKIPDVINWGSRTFQLVAHDLSLEPTREVYQEVFAYHYATDVVGKSVPAG